MPTLPTQPQTEPPNEEATFGLDEVIAALSADLKEARKDAAAKMEKGDEGNCSDYASKAPRLNFSSQFNETPKLGVRAG